MAIYFLLILSHPVAGHTVEDTDRLFQNITKTYKKQHRPVYDQTKILSLSVSFDLVSLQDFDEVEEKFTVTGILYVQWTDDFLRWNPDDFGGIQTLSLHVADVWTPTILHVNAADNIDRLAEDWQPVRVNSSGYIQYFFGNVFTSSCTVNVAYYPVDIQRCELQFFTIGYDENEVAIVPATDEILTGLYIGNGVWDIKNTSVSVQYGGASVSFAMSLGRRPQFVMVNVMFPVVLLFFLNLLIFAIPAESGGRIPFCVTVLLSIAVLLTLVGDNIPKTSSPMALYSYYLLSVLVISMCITIVTIVSERFYHKPEDIPVHARWQRFVLCFQCRRTRRQNVYSNGTLSSRQNSDVIDKTVYHTNTDLNQRMIHSAKPFHDMRRETSNMKNKRDDYYLHERQMPGYRVGQVNEIAKKTKKVTWKDVSVVFDRICFVLFTVLIIVDTIVFAFAISL